MKKIFFLPLHNFWTYPFSQIWRHTWGMFSTIKNYLLHGTRSHAWPWPHTWNPISHINLHTLLTLLLNLRTLLTLTHFLRVCVTQFTHFLHTTHFIYTHTRTFTHTNALFTHFYALFTHFLPTSTYMRYALYAMRKSACARMKEYGLLIRLKKF